MSNRRFPAEWEKQSAIQLTWPHADTDWADMLAEISRTYTEMASAITRHETLIVVTPDIAATRDMLAKSLDSEQMGRTKFLQCDTDDTWARDHGFLTTICDDGIHLLDFKFNGWGEKFEATLDNAINRHLFDSRLLEGKYESHLDFVLEGGSVESDGRGTVFTTSQCLLAPHRNQPLTQAEIEAQLKFRLGAERVVWIDYGHVDGDDTDGHIDTMVRVAPNDTLLYIGGDDQLESQLKTFRTIDGNPYRLMRLPEPTKPCATYANFLIMNQAVLYPTYGQPPIDQEAGRIIAEAFPDRETIGIDSQAIIRQNGSLHCCTMQYY